MSQELKIETATVTVPIGPFVTSDGTAVTAFTLSAGDMMLSKAGGAYAAKDHAASAVHMEFGMFGMLLNSTDIGTLGRLDVKVATTGGGAGKLPVWKELEIVTSSYWDIKGIADFGPAQASTVAGVAQASTLDTVNGQFPLSYVTAIGTASHLNALTTVGVVQSLTTVGVVQSLSYVTGVGTASVLHALSTVGTVKVVQSLTTVGIVQSLTTVGVVQSLSYVTAVGIASVVHSLTTVGVVQSLTTVGVVQSLTTVGTVQSLSSITSVSDIGSVLDVTKSIWDRALTGLTHNIQNSAGKRLRNVEGVMHVEGGTLASATASTFELPGTSNTNNDWYNMNFIVITANTGAVQVRHIDRYVGATKVGEVKPDWITTPDSSSEYDILSLGLVHVDDIAQSGLTSIRNDLDQNSTTLLAINAQHPLSAVVGVAQASSLAAIGPAKNVALSDFSFFMVKSTDHVTPLTSVSPVGYIKKDSGSYASLTNAVAEVSSYGQYVVDFTQTEMNADIISFVFTAAGADQVGIVLITT